VMPFTTCDVAPLSVSGNQLAFVHVLVVAARNSFGPLPARAYRAPAPAQRSIRN
jgi:hypothetical protein